MSEDYKNLLKAPIRKDRKPLHEILPLSKPLRILIDPCDICNLKCKYCFQSYDKEFKGNMMKESLFLLIIEQLKEFKSPINVIHLYGLGEPMLNPNLPQFVRKLKENEVAKEIAITSNGTQLKEIYSEQLIEAGLDRLSISLNGIKDEHFRKFTGKNIEFNKIYRQIKYFYHIRKQCYLHIKINGDYFSKEEQDYFVKLFRDYSDTLNIDHIVNVWSGIKIIDKNNQTMYGGKKEWEKREVEDNILCPQMFYELLIHSDGSVSPCCVDYKYRNNNLGNVRSISLKEIWNGEQLSQMRKDALEGKLSYDICRTCTYPREAATVDLWPYRNELLNKYDIKRAKKLC